MIPLSDNMRHGRVAPGSRVTEQTPMGIREKLKEKPAVTACIAAVFLAIAVGILIWSYWPEKKADLSKAYYSDDDGKTWFAESAFLVTPFQHNGKTAVVAQVYSYDDGKKQSAHIWRSSPRTQKNVWMQHWLMPRKPEDLQDPWTFITTQIS